MDQDTVEALGANGYRLYGFKAVRSTAKGSPLVWFSSENFSLTTQISWQEMYNAYTSRTALKPNTKIVASASYSIDLEQTLIVNDNAGTGKVDTTSGTPGAISIHNLVQVQFTCGISQTDPSGNPVPMCAFNLFGLGLDVIAPIEQVLLMFATDQINTGTVIERAFSPGIKIDLTGAPANLRNVAYAINKGWSWDGSPWGLQIPASANLVPLLVQSSLALSEARLNALHAS